MRKIRTHWHHAHEGMVPHDVSTGAASIAAAIRAESNAVKRVFKLLGPGLITGASDDDPSGIGTYAVAGASLGFGTLWTAPISFPLMTAVQYICAKIGLVSGMGLASVLRRNYSRAVLIPAIIGLLVANTINAGADIGAIAAGINLLVPIPILWLIAPVAALIIALEVLGSYRLIARVFKWLTIVLLGYIIAGVIARPEWGDVLKSTFVPDFQLNTTYLAAIVAIFGTTISPYLFFWQASEEVEEEEARGWTTVEQREASVSDTDLKNVAWDVNIGMAFANIVFYFIILTAATTLFKAGKTDIQSAADAAQALAPLAGNAATILFAIGIIGAGFLAVPVLTASGAYAVCEAAGWSYGLNEKLSKAKHFYIVIFAATVVGVLFNFVGINPITALFWTAIINGLLAPPLLVVIMLISNNKAVMGTRTNSWLLNVLGWAATAIMFTAASALIVSWRAGS